MTRPLRAAERLLRACLPSGAVGLGIIGDLREEYQARADAGRPVRFWYWRETLVLCLRYLLSRPHSRTGRVRGALGVSNDLRVAMRSLYRTPASSTIIVLILGTAMGASTLGFAFADLAVLRGLPIADTDRVVSVYGIDQRQTDGRTRLSAANFSDIRRRVTTIADFAGMRSGRATLVDRGIPTSLDVTRVTPAFFAVMGTHAAAGRLFQRDEETARPVPVVLANHYWQRVYGGDPALVGRSLLIDGREHVVVGVAPATLEFGSLATTDMWLPLEITPDASRTERNVSTIGRLAPGASIDRARAEVSAIARALAQEFPEANREFSATVFPIGEVAFGRGFWVVIALFVAAVTLVMLIACANAASLVLAKAMARRRETALRAALGAGRVRLLRQALVEGAILSLLAAALAAPLAEIALRVMRSFDSEPAIQQIRFDAHELGFLAVVAFFTPMVFAVPPTLAAIRLDLRAALQSGGVRAGAGASRGRSVLVAMQLAFAVGLLVAAGLAVRTGVNLTMLDPGIRTADAMLFGIDLRGEGVRSNAQAFLDAARLRLQTIPGVAGVHAFRTTPVLAAERLITISIDGDAPPPPGVTGPWAFVNGSSAGSLEALGVRLVAGRWMTEDEDRQNRAVALAGNDMAERYFGSAANAVGKRFTLAEGDSSRLEIVGVVSDVLSNDVERGPVPRVWTPLGGPDHLMMIVTTLGRTDGLADAMRREMAALAPATPLEGLETLDAAFARFQASNQVVIGIFAGFALLALVLAATGLYGLIAYIVGQRVPEFGTRFALGARPADVLWLVVRQVAGLIAIGLSVGLAGGLAAGQGMRSILYGVSPTDPGTVAGVVGAILLVALVATIRPAIRAMRINLVEALRAE